jgi:hypothetical protein
LELGGGQHFGAAPIVGVSGGYDKEPAADRRRLFASYWDTYTAI